MAVVDLSKFKAADPANQKVRVGLSKFLYDHMLLPKFLYFVITCAIYSTHTFTCQWFVEDWGLKMKEFGLVSSLTCLNFFGSMFWSFIADRTGFHKYILMGTCLGYAITFTLLLVPFDKDNKTGKIIFACFAYGSSQFFNAALFPLLDNQVVQMIGGHPNFSKEVFGRIRLWSTLGHTFVTLTVGVLIDHLPKDYKNFSMFFALNAFAVMFIILAFFSIENKRVKVEKTTKDKNTVLDKNGNPVSPLSLLVRSPSYIFFLVFIFFASYNRSIMSFFYPYFIKMVQGEKPSALLVALTKVSVSISEIAVFFFGKQLMNYLGVYWMLILAQMTGIIRVMVYAIIPTTGNAWMCSYAVELLKGANTAFLISAAVRILNELAPKGAEASAQGIFSGIYSGISTAAAGALGGYLGDPSVLGGETGTELEKKLRAVQAMFWVTVGISVFGLILFLVKYALIERKLSCQFPAHPPASHHKPAVAAKPVEDPEKGEKEKEKN